MDMNDKIRLHFLEKEGNNFEDFVFEIYKLKYKDIQKVKPQGAKGDGANDGYVRGELVLQVYAPETIKVENAIKKMKKDFCRAKDSGWVFKEWHFIINDKLKGGFRDIHHAIDELEKENKDFNIKLIDSSDLIEIINEYLYSDNSKDKQKVCDLLELDISSLTKILTSSTEFYKNNFIGRKKDLEEITNLLEQNSSLLIRGIGGIGKTSLVSCFLKENKFKFDYYGFVSVTSSLKESFVNSFFGFFNLEDGRLDTLFNKVLNGLQNLEGRKLLVIDNLLNIVNDEESINTILSLQNNDFKIIFTSRESSDLIPKEYTLDTLTIEDSIELFISHLTSSDIGFSDREMISSIINKYLDKHPLFIEMTAKTLSKKSKTLSLEKIFSKFESGDYKAIKRGKISSYSSFLSNFSQDNEVLNDKDSLLFLKRIAILPSVHISFEKLKELLVVYKEGDEFEDLLILLTENGWLLTDGGNYKLHQIIKEYVIDKYEINFDEVKDTIDFFCNYFYKINVNNMKQIFDSQEYLVFLKSVNNSMKKENHEKIAYLLHTEASLSLRKGNLKRVKELFDNSLEIKKAIYNDENSMYLATSFNALGHYYETILDYESALINYKKSFSIRLYNLKFGKEATKKEYKKLLSVEYNNVGRMYNELNKFNKATLYLKKSLKIRKEIFGDYTEQVAKAYNVLGYLYQKKSTFKNKVQNSELHGKAFEFLNKGLEIRENISDNPELDISIAYSYRNLGGYFREREEWSNAILYLNKALKIYNKYEGLSTDKINILNNIGELYASQAKYSSSIKYFNDALQMDCDNENLINEIKENLKKVKMKGEL